MENTGKELEGVSASLAEMTGGLNKLGDGEAKTTMLANRTEEWGREVSSWLSAA